MPKCSPLIERPASRRGLLDHHAPRRRLVGRAQRRQPAVREPAAALERGGHRAAQPHLERLLHRAAGESLTSWKVPGGALVAHRLARPQPPQQRQRLVDERAAALGLDADRLALRRVGEAGHQRHQQPPAGTARPGSRAAWPAAARCARAAASWCRASAAGCSRRPTPGPRPDRAPGPVSTSESQSESKPSSSMPVTSSPSAAGVGGCAGGSHPDADLHARNHTAIVARAQRLGPGPTLTVQSRQEESAMSERATHPVLELAHTALSEEDALRLLDGHRIRRGSRTMDPKAQIVGEFVKSIRVPGYFPPLPELRQQLRTMVTLMDEPAPALARIENIAHSWPGGRDSGARLRGDRRGGAAAGRGLLSRRRLGAGRPRDASRPVRAAGPARRRARRGRRLPAGARAQVPRRGRGLPGGLPLARAPTDATSAPIPPGWPWRETRPAATSRRWSRSSPPPGGVAVPTAQALIYPGRRLLARDGVASRAGRRSRDPARSHSLVRSSICGARRTRRICGPRRCARRAWPGSRRR